MIELSSSPSEHTARSGSSEADQVRLIFDRLLQAAAEHETVDGLAQALSVVTAEVIGDSCSITVPNLHDEAIHIAGLYDPDPTSLAVLRQLLAVGVDLPRDQGDAAQVILTGEPILRRSIPEESVRAIPVAEFQRYFDQVGIESMMVVPLKGRAGVIGAVSVSRHRGGRPYTEADLALLTDMALRMSIAIENLMLIESLRAQVAAASSARAALAVSEERFRSIFQSTTQGVEVMDVVGTVIDTNPAFESMTGYTRSELVGRFFAGFIHPEDAEAVAHIFTGIKLNRTPEGVLEHRVLRKDGSLCWLRTSFAGIRSDPRGETVDLVVAMHENITGRVRTEQYFQAVLESTPDALIMTDAEGRVLLLNRQAEKLFGYRRSEVLGAPVETLIPDRFRAEHPAHRRTYLQEPVTRPMGHTSELFALRRDGTEVPVDVSLSYLEVDGGPVVVTAVRDITERRQREAALVRSERSLAAAQRVAHLGSLEYDLLTGTVEASEEALRILGVTREQLTGSPAIQALIHPDDLPGVLKHTQSVLTTHEPEEFEFRLTGPEGRVRIIYDRVVPFFSPEGTPTRLLGTIQDVTEQREAEQEVAELKSHLQSSVELERLRLAQDLHDGPMQDLYGASYHLDELQRLADEELGAGLHQVEQQVQHTISELRDIARELRPPAISTFGLEKAIRSYVHDFHDKHPNMKLEISLARDHQMLPEDTRLTLFRVLQQALINVVRHSHADAVSIRFSLDAEEARLSIADNGKGFRVPSNWIGFVRDGHYGLAGAAERLNALGGRLLVDSDPGRSTVVTAIVPWNRSAQ